MIVRPRPHPLQLLFIIRGSVILRVAPRVLFVATLSCLVVWAAQALHFVLNASAVPFSTMAIALSVFLGFRNNACYDRWWEARKLWGELIIQSRAFSRECTVLPDSAGTTRLVRATIGFAHALAAHLRQQDSARAAAPWLPADTAATLARHPNIPEAVLRDISKELVSALQAGALSDIVYQGLQQRLLALAFVQGGCERIRSTPTPFAYSLLLHRTAWLFCLLLPFGLVGALGLMTPVIVSIIAYTFFALDELGDELEEPFGLSGNDLPLNALVRTIEIDLLDSLGETDLPAPLLPADFVLL